MVRGNVGTLTTGADQDGQTPYPISEGGQNQTPWPRDLPGLRQRRDSYDYVSSDEDSDDDDGQSDDDGDDEYIEKDCGTDSGSDDASDDEGDDATNILRPRLAPPVMNDGSPVTGANKEKHRLENKRRRQQKQADQSEVSYWKNHKGQFSIPTPKQSMREHKGSMCPSGLALEHPAAELLNSFARDGCPTTTGRPWTHDEIEAAIEVGPHISALAPEAMRQLQLEVEDKVKKKQCRVVEWEDIKHNPPEQLKVSRIAMIPHKSRRFRAILDLSYAIKLECGGVILSVNEDGASRSN